MLKMNNNSKFMILKITIRVIQNCPKMPSHSFTDIFVWSLKEMIEISWGDGPVYQRLTPLQVSGRVQIVSLFPLQRLHCYVTRYKTIKTREGKLLTAPFTRLHYLVAKNRGRHHDLYIQVLRAESSTNSEEMSSSTPASFLAMQV